MKKLITIISLIAIVSLLASFLVVPASAEILTGSCGESVTYSFNEGTRELVISGTGPMADSVTEWNSFKTTVTKVTIQNGVTSIGKRAFSGFTILETIDIPASVQAIGNSAFADCLKLDGVIIPDGITTIERSTFSECYALSSIVIPNSVTIIKDSAFSGCGELKTVEIGSGVTTIEADAFLGCTKLDTITLPTGLTTIGTNAFATSTKIKNINFYCGTQEQWDAIKANFKVSVTPNFHLNETDNPDYFVCALCGQTVGEAPAEDIVTTEATEATTAAATTTAAEATTAPATTEPTKEGGCGSSIAISALAILPTLAGGALLLKRKED